MTTTYRTPPAHCLDCSLPYAEFDLDLTLPRGQWLLIHPDEHGLLCARCIIARAAKIPGATVVHAVIEVARDELCRCERLDRANRAFADRLRQDGQR